MNSQHSEEKGQSLSGLLSGEGLGLGLHCAFCELQGFIRLKYTITLCAQFLPLSGSLHVQNNCHRKQASSQKNAVHSSTHCASVCSLQCPFVIVCRLHVDCMCQSVPVPFLLILKSKGVVIERLNVSSIHRKAYFGGENKG